MISETNIRELVETHLEGTSLFLVHLKVSLHNKIAVYLDGDEGVKIADCSALSRFLERELDRDVEDFELEVSSVGVGQPLQMVRQYHNNLGRRLAVKHSDGTVSKGRLVEVSEAGIRLEKDKPSKSGKKKKEVESDAETKLFISFEDIEEAKVQVSFKK